MDTARYRRRKLINQIGIGASMLAMALGLVALLWILLVLFGKGIGANGFIQMHGGIELPTNKQKAVNESFLRTTVGYTIAQDQGYGRAWTPMAELLIAHPYGESTEVDVVPQMQVSLSKLQHILDRKSTRLNSSH